MKAKIIFVLFVLGIIISAQEGTYKFSFAEVHNRGGITSFAGSKLAVYSDEILCFDELGHQIGSFDLEWSNNQLQKKSLLIGSLGGNGFVYADDNLVKIDQYLNVNWKKELSFEPIIIRTDNAGYTYVLGHNNISSQLEKYDLEGNKLWSKQLDLAGSSLVVTTSFVLLDNGTIVYCDENSPVTWADVF